MLKKLISQVIFITIPLFYFNTYSQGSITINHKTQRFINNESEFKRDKYFHIHQLTNLTDPEFIDFQNTFDFASDYRGARLLDSPMKNHNKTGIFPAVQNNFSGVRAVENRFASTTPAHYFYDADVDYSAEDMTQYIDELTTYMTDFYRYQDPMVPKYIEPLNEPMIHTGDYTPAGPGFADRKKILNTRICELHRELGKKIHAAPELANMKVAGFGSAFPTFEANNFGLWNARYKKFIDIAGEDVDVLTVHLYDGVGVNNSGGRRSGSNVEAILDLIETYSNIKLNTVKPIAITEFGRLVPNQPGFPNPGVRNYEPVENSQAVRSQMHMTMAFMERGNDIEYTIPFTMNKQSPTGTFSKSSLWNRVSTNPNVWEYTPRVNFFEIWKSVKGERVQINSSNIDVQTQAFVDGNKLFVVLNNLNDITQTVNLNLTDNSGLQNVQIKRLKIFLDKVPEITETTQNSAPSDLTLAYGETAVLTYTFDALTPFENVATSKKYYSKNYLKTVTTGVTNTFVFNDVVKGNTTALLRLGLGRNHGLSLRPTIEINGNPIALPQDVIRGYDQNTRSSFFGTLEIPFDVNFLNTGTNNVSVTFDDNGGHITSTILQIENTDTNTSIVERIALSPLPTTLASSDTYTFNVDYAVAEERDLLIVILDGNQWKGATTIPVSTGSGSTKITVNLDEALPVGDNYTIRAIIRERGGNFNTNKELDEATGVTVTESTLSNGLDFNINEENSTAIYPNPTSEILNRNQSGDWMITSLAGKILLTGSIEQQINVSALKSGIYLLIQEGNNQTFVKN